MANEPTTAPALPPEQVSDPPPPQLESTPNPTQVPDTPQLEPETVKATKHPKCPNCGDALDVYAGENLLKACTAFCHRCGLRHHLKG